MNHTLTRTQLRLIDWKKKKIEKLQSRQMAENETGNDDFLSTFYLSCPLKGTGRKDCEGELRRNLNENSIKIVVTGRDSSAIW
jgi:hypothetical protein